MPARRVSAELFDPTAKEVITQLLTDISALRVDVAAQRAAIVALTAKLDADVGVTDTNYAATINPPASTSTTATVVA